MFPCFSDVTTSSARTARRHETHCGKKAPSVSCDTEDLATPHDAGGLLTSVPIERRNSERVVRGGLSCVSIPTFVPSSCAVCQLFDADVVSQEIVWNSNQIDGIHCHLQKRFHVFLRQSSRDFV